MTDYQTDSGATLSFNRKYRYRLWRIWDCDLATVLFIGLNPSTADENEDDPTIRRCIGFARQWGYGGILMGNLFALRATNPMVMKNGHDPIGPMNGFILAGMIQKAPLVVACWGAHGSHNGRERQVAAMFSGFKCFGVTKDGHPRHPLYLRSDTQLIDWPTTEP